MKNKITFALSIMLVGGILLGCKFNLGGENTATGNGPSNAANRSTARSDAPKKTVAKDETAEEPVESDAPDSDTSEMADLRIKRSFFALDEDRPKDLLEQDGDYMYFQKLESGGTAGYFYSTKPQEAIYVLWDGKVIAGPLTTRQQVEEVTAILSNNMKNEHEMRMNILKNHPTGIFGRERVRVYDEKGRLIREQ